MAAMAVSVKKLGVESGTRSATWREIDTRLDLLRGDGQD